MSNAEISVLLVSYNAEPFIAEAVAGIQAQAPDRPTECIVADDCSTDGTRERLEEWASRAPFPVTVLASPTNLGITDNYARGFAACTGRYVAVLEGDDRWIAGDKLSTQAQYLDDHPDCSFAFNRELIEFSGGDSIVFPYVVGLDGRNGITFTAEQLAAENVCGNFSSCMYRRDVITSLDPAIFSATMYDWLFNLAMAERGRIGFIPRVMSSYRVHDGGRWSGLTLAEQYERLATLIHEYDTILGGRLAAPLREQWRRLAALYPVSKAMTFMEPTRAHLERTPAPALRSGSRDRPTPRVSVVMATSDDARHVDDAICSVLEQSCAELELIVVDDASEDETVRRLSQVDDERLQVLRLHPRQGSAAAWNLATQQAASEFIAYIDARDVWEPAKLERQLAMLDASPAIAAAFTGAALISEQGKPLTLSELPSWHLAFRQPDRSRGRWLRQLFEHGNSLCRSSAIVRRQVLDEIGQFDSRLVHLADYERWITLIKKAPIAVLGDEPLVRFRTSAGDDDPTLTSRAVHEHLVICQGFFDRCSPELVADGFGDLFVDPMATTPEELACEEVNLWLNGPSDLHPIYRFHGVSLLYELLGRPRERELLRRRYGLVDSSLHELATDLADASTRGALDEGAWLGPAFGQRTVPEPTSGGRRPRARDRNTGTPNWPAAAWRRVARRGQ